MTSTGSTTPATQPGRAFESLPAYSEYVASVEAAPDPRPRWPFLILIVLGTLLVLAPLVTGMFPRSAQGEQMIGSFAPQVNADRLAEYRADLDVLEQARQNVITVGEVGAPPGRYPMLDTFVTQYPGIRQELTTMIDTIDAQRGNYDRLAAVPSFGALPWLMAVPGVVFVVAGVLGRRRAGAGGGTGWWRTIIASAAVVLVATGLFGGLFAAAPAATPLLDGFAPILTHDQVRRVQGHFVTLVAADGELNSRYTADMRAAYPAADLGGVLALEARWQPMTSRFATLIGTMNDNIDNFRAVAALDATTSPLGFTAFRALGWFFVVPGVLGLALAGSGARARRTGVQR